MNLIKTVVLAGVATLGMACMSSNSQVVEQKSDKPLAVLKDAYADKFYMGTALNLDQIWDRNPAAIAVVKKHFNSVVAENCMKSMFLQPREGEFYFDDADRFVKFGEENNMHLVGHTLIWHSQAPKWFFTDKKGNDVSRDVLIDRMRNHIHTIVSRYKGRIHGWDVVNEAILDNGEYRKSKFYEIIGEDFIPLAFQFAREADPEAELYYNDYSTAIPAKRDGIVKMVQKVIDSGIKVDGLGMQEHHGLDHASIQDVENTIEAFAALGTKVMVTEMDISVLPHARAHVGAELSDTSAYSKTLDPYREGLSADVMEKLGKRYVDFFTLYTKHQDKISRVTLWGVGDGDSWKNDWPIHGRTDYPLLFDRDYQPKPFFADILEIVK
ncbi:endo-1,4-beta-xylanase [Sphingobacterium corticibacterium]|uniref:Beta-xylanase n=1 Tax=Sphingobacterium corticibacterium TaxID=2484746 RepID=A0A4Q6XRH2_9SPHI|nr:endo-1,4-beta-xylanase [Sphingobacterium corticibacterium]RZF59309.1 endo-1,4-beta-xylanase [Sphingobacterium corticibacterium]